MAEVLDSSWLELGADAAVAADSGRDFAAFKELESTLRDNPEDIPADVRALLTGQGGCTDQALAS